MKDNLHSAKALYILLAIFVFGVCLLSGPALYLYPDYIFKIELFIILLYTLIHKKFPYKTILSNPYLVYGIIAWITVISLRKTIIIYRYGLNDLWLYFQMSFHVVFLIYAIDIIAKMRAHKSVKNSFNLFNKLSRENALFILLCGLTFSIALTGESLSLKNADTVSKHELIFIAAYIFIFSTAPNFKHLLRQHKFTGYSLLLWFLVVTISYLTSPYELITKYLGISRYHQTFIHVLFFIFVYQFFVDTNTRPDKAILMIPLSVVVVALIFILSWLNLDAGTVVNWFNKPPLNAHIRHVGYIATASTSITVAYILHPANNTKHTTFYTFLFLISSTLLMWTGGRAAAASFGGAFLFILGYFTVVRSLELKRLMVACATLFVAFLFSELFAIFDWNGMLQGLARSAESTDLQTLTTGRWQIWHSVVESLENHWIFGLGPQAYIFMPNRLYGMQAHNMFLQFITEWGLVGGAIFILLLVRVKISILGTLRDRAKIAAASHLSAIAVLISLTLHGVVDGTYFHGQPSYYIALAMAICVAVLINTEKGIRTNSIGSDESSQTC